MRLSCLLAKWPYRLLVLASVWVCWVVFFSASLSQPQGSSHLYSRETQGVGEPQITGQIQVIGQQQVVDEPRNTVEQSNPPQLKTLEKRQEPDTGEDQQPGGGSDRDQQPGGGSDRDQQPAGGSDRDRQPAGGSDRDKKQIQSGTQPQDEYKLTGHTQTNNSLEVHVSVNLQNQNHSEKTDLDLPSTGHYRTLEVNLQGPFHAWWPDDDLCSGQVVRFGRNVEGALLHSFPRSGNTWVRYLLEAATGVFTSSAYKDFTLIRAGYLGERSKLRYRDTVVTKIHFVKHLQKYSYTPAITIIRNPARVIVSLWSYHKVRRRRHKHTAAVDISTFNTSEFHNFCGMEIKKWLWTTRFTLEQNRKSLFPVYYEQVREDPMRETRRMLEFLQLRPDEERLACLARNVEGKAKGAQKKFNPFTDEELEQIHEAVRVIGDLLAEGGYPPLPDYSRYDS